MFFTVTVPSHQWWLCWRRRWRYSRYVCKKKGVKESGKFNFVSVGLYPRDLYVGKRSRVNRSGAEWWRGRQAKEEKRGQQKKKQLETFFPFSTWWRQCIFYLSTLTSISLIRITKQWKISTAQLQWGMKNFTSGFWGCTTFPRSIWVESWCSTKF